MAGPVQRVVLASGNAGKLRELAALLAPQGFQLVLQSELGIESPEETGSTFTENALLKARHASQASGLPAIADDSGLEVDALGGRPGVRSARYAGEGASDEQNLTLLLEELRGVADAARTARFRCVIAFVQGPHDPAPRLAHGAWQGRIALAPRGAGGFGYDPVFLPDGAGGRTSAELAAAEKNAASHRGAALRDLLRQIGAA